jgi:hypothetical protein
MKWNNKEALILYRLRERVGLDFDKISKKLGRSKSSCEKKYQSTNWKDFIKLLKEQSKQPSNNHNGKKEAYIDQLVTGIIQLSRYSPDRLRDLTKEDFYKNTVLDTKRLPITFTELKKRALYELEQIGFSYSSVKELGEGTYIIVGDCHGKHTRSGMFNLLQKLNNHLNAKAIIHLGHILDDDNTINYHWENFDNLIVIAKEEELKFVAKSDILTLAEIIRKEVKVGNISIQNQDLISDYVQTFVSSVITPEYFEESTIVNLHRHEFDTRCTEEGKVSFVASPGCLCEEHIVYTIKQQDFTDGRTVKLTFPTGYKKYRRMKHMYKTWQQGFLVIHVSKDGIAYPVQCRVKVTSKGYTTAYFDKIITEHGVLEPQSKTFVNTDLHCDYHDGKVLDIQRQICDDYKPNDLVCLGDVNENKSINHHVFKRNASMRVTERKTLQESASTHYVMKKIRSWAKNMYVLLGNHERFYKDFTDQFPQFSDILNFSFINNTDALNINIIDLKQTKCLNFTTYVHGDMILMGQKGGLMLDKIFRTYGKNTVMGHCHYPSSRFDCHTVGLSGKMDLDYNETNASKWVHGCLLVREYEQRSFISHVLIIDNKTFINNKLYECQNENEWKVPQVKAHITFEF